MKKLFISADIEGTCGITDWDETEKGRADYAYFARQMSREVAAACQGALQAGYGQILVKDAHDSARNIDPTLLPMEAEILRGWGGDPFGMMLGLDKGFDGVVMTGYHDAAGRDSNPLAHTWSTSLYEVKINGEVASELYINSLTAAYAGVPVYCVTGDKGLCDWMKQKSPHTAVVPVNIGSGAAVRSIHPEKALKLIEEAVDEALRQPKELCLFPMPDHFDVEISYREHARARKCSFYPGMRQLGPRSLLFKTDDYYEVLRMMQFAM